MTEKEYLAAIYGFNYFGPVRTGLLLNYFGSAESSWNAKSKDLLSLGLSSKLISEFDNYRKNFDASSYFARLREKHISFVTVYEDDYPENLKGIEGAPLVLYYIGKLKPSFRNAVAIVGSRKMSSYGKEMANKISSELSSLGITIVSGLALGIDAEAHKACINAGGKGIIVLASGLDTISPLTNLWIAKEIVKLGGLIVSEYPLGQPPFRTSFPSRNRIVSGLSKAVIVVEGYKKSGTLLTASAAAEQGRTVYGVPGQITSPLSFAPHYLIQNGARIFTSVNDVMEELDIELRNDPDEMEKMMPSDKTEKAILESLENSELHMDEIVKNVDMEISDLASKMTLMEIKGLIRNLGGGTYKKR